MQKNDCLSASLEFDFTYGSAVQTAATICVAAAAIGDQRGFFVEEIQSRITEAACLIVL